MNARDFIIVVGNQQCGKSVWAKLYAASKKRLLVFDPMASYANVDFVTPPDEFMNDLVARRLNEFRFGTPWVEELPMFANAAAAAGECALLIEESSLCFDRGEKIPEWLRHHVFMGTHIGVDRIFIAQRAASIPIDVRSQASRIVTFRQTEPADVKAACERMGREYMDELPALEKLHCLDWSADTGAVRRYSIRPA